MSKDSSRKPEQQHAIPKWEPYLFTAGILTAVVLFAIAFGFLAEIPYIQPILLSGFTISVVYEACRASARIPSKMGIVVKGLVALCFFLVSAGAFSKYEYLLGIWFGAIAFVWICLVVQAVMVRRTRLKQHLENLDRTIEAVRRALDEESSE